jgi:hypothetical protein
MFGLGFGKLLLLVAIVVAVWYAFTMVGRLDRRRKRKIAENREKASDSIDKMEKCPVCGTYVVAERAANCGRRGCPY